MTVATWSIPFALIPLVESIKLSKTMSRQRYKVTVEGIVQGVGFRPFVYQLAQRFKLAGSVFNDTRGVTIEVEGDENTIHQFIVAISDEKPPLAVIQSLESSQIPIKSEVEFVIQSSVHDEQGLAQVPPDTYVCHECLQELFDPFDRRFRYPFINCTNCGPRYTIVTGIPYDRPLTTMADFPFCPDCRNEYKDPGSRRFHAQPNACPVCGPELQLLNSKGEQLDGDPLEMSVQRLRKGKIFAIKGIGGFHLAVDARNSDAVKALRLRKQRDEKPFALMAKDLNTVREFAQLRKEEVSFLESLERPIVLLKKRHNHDLADNIAPRNRYFGVMLPYSPVHYLLLDTFPVMVMTSANFSEEPIVYENDVALDRLGGIADYFLVHNRRIQTRTDDSIARVMADRPLLIRRSRGYVPRGIALPNACAPVLAVGAELKNTICLTRGDRAFLSQHIGDLKNLEVFESFKKTIAHMKSILEVEPRVIAHDLHPDYYSSRYAFEESGLETVPVQHHHAHLASCLAEHGVNEKAIGMIFDGIGFGEDGHVWGGEFLVGDLLSFERVGHFKYQPMPGGDLATVEPWRMALSYLKTAVGTFPADLDVFEGLEDYTVKLVSQAIDKRINTPLSSSCGRLFDGVAALINLRQKVSFEGQAAMELEMIADPEQQQPYRFEIHDVGGQFIFDPSVMINDILDDYRKSCPSEEIAGRFHFTLATMIGEVCSQIRKRTALNKVVLSGGVFQNCLLTEMTLKVLESSEFDVLTHSLVPPNDGGLALGQAAVAGARYQESQQV